MRAGNTKLAFPDRAFIGSVGSLIYLTTWVVCNYSVLHGLLGQFRWPYTGLAVRQWRILFAQKKHPFKPREHLPGSLITNSMHRRFPLFFRTAFAWNIFISRRRALLPFLLFSSPFLLSSVFLLAVVAASISIVDRAMTSISLARCATRQMRRRFNFLISSSSEKNAAIRVSRQNLEYYTRRERNNNSF